MQADFAQDLSVACYGENRYVDQCAKTKAVLTDRLDSNSFLNLTVPGKPNEAEIYRSCIKITK